MLMGIVLQRSRCGSLVEDIALLTDGLNADVVQNYNEQVVQHEETWEPFQTAHVVDGITADCFYRRMRQ